MSEDKFIHIFINFPRLGLLRKTTDSNKVMKKMKKSIWKQLKKMSLEHFSQYCEIRRLKEDPTKNLELIKPGARFELPEKQREDKEKKED